MGKFSSRTIKKDSPKTSPDESRETSPSRKSPDRRRDRRAGKDDRTRQAFIKILMKSISSGTDKHSDVFKIFKDRLYKG